MNMDIWIVGTSNQLFKEVLKFKQYFDRNKVVTGKTPFFVVHFVLTILFVLIEKTMYHNNCLLLLKKRQWQSLVTLYT